MTLCREAGYHCRRGKTNRPLARETYVYNRRSCERTCRRFRLPRDKFHFTIALAPANGGTSGPISVAINLRVCDMFLFFPSKSIPSCIEYVYEYSRHYVDLLDRCVWDVAIRRFSFMECFTNTFDSSAIFVYYKSFWWHHSFVKICFPVLEWFKQ